MTNEQLKRILFIDIETATVCPQWQDMNENMQQLWVKKSKTLRVMNEEDADPARLFEDKAGIFSEFSKVVCISIGSLVLQESQWIFRLKSIFDSDEKILLNNFLTILSRFESANKDMKFCGHNIKEFDLPFLCRRMIINGLSLAPALQLNNKKPWEIMHIDTLELWKFGDYKNYTSLALLAEVLGIPSPKSDIDGSMVGKVYWEEKNTKRIAQYCMQDVLTTAKVFLKLSGLQDMDMQVAYL
ncbi:MAG: ribonuclease H-like domain-containing protein [Bacteroidota bacterium]